MDARDSLGDTADSGSECYSVEYERKSDASGLPLTTASEDALSQANISVFCRFRPFHRRKAGYEDDYDLHFSKSGADVALRFSTNIGHPVNAEAYRFSFDSCFDGNATQEQVYNRCAKPMVEDLVRGYNCTLFAYGQTGSGKTYTMMGDLEHDSKKGILPRLAEDLFIHVGGSGDRQEFCLKLSFIEIYMERIRDLLADDHSHDQPYSLKLRNDEDHGVFIDGVIEQEVSNAAELYQLLDKGNTNRAVGYTKMNAKSSRSHSVCMLTLCQSSEHGKKVGKMFVVDLAGSEMVKKTGASLSTLNEAKQINKSLSALGNVIKALTEKAPFIPYRDSKLTLLLKNSLGGDTKTSLIVTCAGGTRETLSTLRFGSRAKQIQNKPTVQESFCTNPECKKLRIRLEQLEEENAELGVVDVLSNLTGAEQSCLGETQVALKECLAENDSLRQQLEDKSIEAEALKAMLQKSSISKSQHIEIHERDLNACLRENEELKQNLAKLEEDIKKLKENAGSEDTSNEAESSAPLITSKEEILEAELVALTQKFIRTRVELDDLRDGQPSSNEDVLDLKARNEFLEAQQKIAERKMDAFKSRTTALETKLSNRESKF